MRKKESATGAPERKHTARRNEEATAVELKRNQLEQDTGTQQHQTNIEHVNGLERKKQSKH
jgi:hypothetical protein